VLKFSDLQHSPAARADIDGWACDVRMDSFQTRAERMQLNDTEIRVHGLQRSGNHAIMNWIAAQSPGICVVLNDCEPRTNPFDSMQEYCEYSDGSVVALLHTWNCATRELVHPRIPQQRKLLIHSYEDRELLGDRVSESWIGSSNLQFEVLIVRDPLNFFASRLQMWGKLTGLKERHRVVELWKKYAREALGLTSVLEPARKVLIEFGKWKDDVGYRRHVAAKLAVDFSDRGIDSMIEIGPGSSFDGFDYRTKASEMAVNERWKSFIGDEVYRSILADKELQDLSVRLFGQHAGWEEINQPAAAS
jgi:hypothetical protein